MLQTLSTGKSMSGSKEMQPEDDAEAVLKTLEESGVFDELRQQLLIQVKANKKLQEKVQEAVVASKHLPAVSSDRRARAVASEQIRRELTAKTLDSILQTVWEEMSAPGSDLVKSIGFETHAALCRIYEQRLGQTDASS